MDEGGGAVLDPPLGEGTNAHHEPEPEPGPEAELEHELEHLSPRLLFRTAVREI